MVRRYLTTEDLTDSIGSEPRRWVIDFGTQSFEQARTYPRSLAVVRRDVKPERDQNTQRHFARLWWQFAWPRPRMRLALRGLSRFIALTLTGKRFLVAWAEASWCPSNLVGVVALNDDYARVRAILAVGDLLSWSRC